MKSIHGMKPISINTILAAVEILGAQECVDDEIEKRVRALVEDDMTMRRLVDIIPEAFGLVVASHLPSASGMTLPDTFSVQDKSGAWRSVPITREPVFVAALEIAQHIFHSGPRHVLRNNAERSSIFAAVSKALDSGDSLEGSTLGGPAFLGLSISLYS
ncbi:hypothetical protein [Burkholderia ubonensis]|uniref:hypothetical protein n=1 Tax=Burkholderia ubonensis TaxID=101571 RepID=UPI0012F9B1F5|nr:hypothetical protein [Burkholderia ubonensis]